MRAIAANLKPLYESPSFWFWHVLGGFVCIAAYCQPFVSPDPTSGVFVAGLAVPVWSGYVAASLFKDLMLRPFTFTLPAYRDVLRRTVLWLGFAVGAIGALPVLAYPGLDLLERGLALGSTLCFGVALYLSVLATVFLVGNANFLFAPFLILTVMTLEFVRARLVVQEVSLFTPAATVPLVALLGILVWRNLGRVELARKICGSRFLSLQRMWKRTANEEFSARGRLEARTRRRSGPCDWLVQTGLESIAARPALSLRRHVTAVLVETAGRLLPASPWSFLSFVFFLLLVLAAVGYAPVREERPEILLANLVYLVPCILGSTLPIPMFTTTILPAGRTERFRTGVLLGGLNGLLVLATSLLLCGLFLVLADVVPPIRLGSETHFFRIADPRLLWFPLVFTPVAQIIQLLCRRWTLVPLLILFGISVLLLGRGGTALAATPIWLALLLVGLAWAFLLGVLHRIARHCDLVP